MLISRSAAKFELVFTGLKIWSRVEVVEGWGELSVELAMTWNLEKVLCTERGWTEENEWLKATMGVR
jgi:hypothetical protein